MTEPEEPTNVVSFEDSPGDFSPGDFEDEPIGFAYAPDDIDLSEVRATRKENRRGLLVAASGLIVVVAVVALLNSGMVGHGAVELGAAESRAGNHSTSGQAVGLASTPRAKVQQLPTDALPDGSPTTGPSAEPRQPKIKRLHPLP